MPLILVLSMPCTRSEKWSIYDFLMHKRTILTDTATQNAKNVLGGANPNVSLAQVRVHDEYKSG